MITNSATIIKIIIKIFSKLSFFSFPYKSPSFFFCFLSHKSYFNYTIFRLTCRTSQCFVYLFFLIDYLITFFKTSLNCSGVSILTICPAPENSTYSLFGSDSCQIIHLIKFFLCFLCISCYFFIIFSKCFNRKHCL